MRRVPLAWKNLLHQPKRLALAALAIGFAVLLMCVQLGFRAGMLESTVALLRVVDGDILIASRTQYAMILGEAFPRRRLQQAMQCPGVISADPLYIETRVARLKSKIDGIPRPIRVIGLDPRAELLDRQFAGGWQRELTGAQTIALDRRMKQDFGRFTPGETAEVSDRRLRVVGIFELGSDFAYDGNAFCSIDTFREVFRTRLPREEALARVDLGVIKVAPGTNPRAICEELRRRLPSDTQVFIKDDFINNELAFWNASTPIGFVFTLGVALAFVVGVIVCYQILAADIGEHLAEFATLRAMGYSANYFRALVGWQALLLAALGFIPGVLAALVAYLALGWQTGLIMEMTFQRTALVFFLTATMCVASSFLALRKLLSTDPAELFR